MNTSNRIPLKGVKLDEAVYSILQDIAEGKSSCNLFVNAYSIALTEKLPSYKHILQNNKSNFIDGRIIQWLVNLRKNQTSKKYQIRGTDLTREILRNIPSNHSIYFLGGSLENLDELTRLIPKLYPNVRIAGCFSPPFELEWNDYIRECVEKISDSGANLVLVSLGTPKQDFVAHYIALNCKLVTVSIGAALDFLTMRIPECPKIIQKIGLEWSFRLIQEPKRLWRRYLLDSPKAIQLFIKGIF